ncbi:MAG TPA: 3'-5' exonuclease [Pseudidiomarina sp.]|nr:3'-5' exonuclease [Pseudidiomarina sp.]
MTVATALKRWWQRQQLLRQHWTDARYVVLDIETSGLDVRHDVMLAVAWIEVQPPYLDYSSARYFVLESGPDSTHDLKQSPVVHGLLQRDFVHSSDTQDVLNELAKVLKDAVLVCHHTHLDWQFLQAAARDYDMNLEPLGWFDTLQFELRRLRNQHHHIPRGSLTLAAARQRYQLADYYAHHAFNDAVACAELMLAQGYRYAGSAKASVKNLLQVGRVRL